MSRSKIADEEERLWQWIRRMVCMATRKKTYMDVGEDGIDVGDLEPGLFGERELMNWEWRDGEGGSRAGWDAICRRWLCGAGVKDTASGWGAVSVGTADMEERKKEEADRMMVKSHEDVDYYGSKAVCHCRPHGSVTLSWSYIPALGHIFSASGINHGTQHASNNSVKTLTTPLIPLTALESSILVGHK
jgi:hypothetical protein